MKHQLQQHAMILWPYVLLMVPPHTSVFVTQQRVIRKPLSHFYQLKDICEQSSSKVVVTNCPPNIWQLFSEPWRQSSPFNLYKLISDDLSGNDLLSSLISSLFSSCSMLSAPPSNQYDEIIHTKLPMAGIANTYLSRSVDLRLVAWLGWIIGLVYTVAVINLDAPLCWVEETTGPELRAELVRTVKTFI